MSMNLNHRIAVVTGASAGIGAATARHLASEGACVVLNARRAERLSEIARKINTETGREAATTAPGDCAEPEVIESLFAKAEAAFGRPADLVVVNAGRGLDGSILTSDPDQWEEMIRTNFVGAARLMRAAAEHLLAAVPEGQDWQNHPRDIVVLGSVVGRNVSPFSSAYGSTKFAVHGLTEGLRREIGPKGIRVTLIEPAFVVSEFQGVAGYDEDWVKAVFEKIGPVLEPADIARTIALITSQPARVHLSEVMIRPTRQDYP
jgi:NADP-dependent 3-hydroxy acid dehydrogenase YdfG